MRPHFHIAASLSMGTVVGISTESLYAGLVCFFSGVLVDVDHIIEYIIHNGLKGFSLRKVYQACEATSASKGKMRFPKLYLIFHSGEAAILLWIATLYIKNIYLIALAFGYSIHIIMDSMANPMYLYSYLIIWRATKNFNASSLFRK